MRSREVAVAQNLKPILLLFLGTLIILLVVGVALAQETSGPWNDPVNLSLSAGTSDPVIVVDSSGNAHAVWKDANLTFVHTFLENGKWRPAQPVELPFGTRRYYPDLSERQATPLHTPVLWSDGDGQVHALWLDTGGRLLYSNVPSTDFAEFAAWSVPRELALSASGAAAIADESGRLHTIFVRPAATLESPSGLYYRASNDGGETWSAPALLYDSPYFRSISEEQINLQLAARADGPLIAAWDNPYEERVYVARSGDAGMTWEGPQEIDRRVQADGSDAVGPNSIQVASADRQIHLLWQAGHDGFLCAQYHAVSIDNGVTWGTPERLVPTDDSCSDSSFLIAGEDDVVLLFAMNENGGRVRAWNGSQWGETATREELVQFINPANFRQVELACHQVVSGADGLQGNRDSAIVLGCDTGPGGDVWALGVAMEPLARELTPQAKPTWHRPDVLAQATESESLKLLADADGWLHAFWVQPISAEDSATSAYYSRWDGTGWSQPRALLQLAEGQQVAEPAMALSHDNKMMAAWTDGTPGSLYFSQVDLNLAGNPSEWSSPITLPAPSEEVSAPEITVNLDGVIYVAYAVPLNEGRGVYLTQSIDGGENWSDPTQVFDGAAAGWAMVDKPHLVAGTEGTLHLLWTRFSSPPEASPLSLHYRRSSDGGASWSEDSEVASKPGVWSDLQTSGDLAVHRFWLAENDDLWHQASSDGGISWGQPQRVSGAGDTLPIVDSMLDGAGRPWLLQAAGTRTDANEMQAPFELRGMYYDEGRWATDEALQLGSIEIGGFAVAATSSGDLNVIFSAMISDIDTAAAVQTIYHSSRSLDLPLAQPTALPTLTPTPPAVTTMTPTPQPMPTATISFPTDPGQDSGLPIPIDTSNPLTGPILGIIPAAAVVLIAFFIGVRLLRGDRRR